MNFDTNTKLNIILAILAIILVLAMILVFRGTGEPYATCGGKSNDALPDGTIMKDNDHNKKVEPYETYALSCPNSRCNDIKCNNCKKNPTATGCSVCFRRIPI
jgi:hypothetical protein